MMDHNKICTIIANAVSIGLYPLFIPTYGMIMYMCMMQSYRQELPIVYVGVAIGGTLLLTALIPIALIVMLWMRKQISSLHIDDPKERTTPYIYAIVCFGFWCYFVHTTIHLPLVWLLIALGATIALIATTVINHWWKISAHLTALGGLLGGICSMSYIFSIMPIALIITILCVSLILMYARLYLNAHTPMQVIGGYILGIICTFIPTLIISHV
jgi:membrane-associated phospholipid phosphatase